MKVMVTGGTGRRGADALIATEVLDRLNKAREITGLVASKDPDANEAAMEWWARRYFAPAFVSGPADVAVILPSSMAVQRLREARYQCRTIVIVGDGGLLEVIDGCPEVLEGRA